MKKRLLIAIFAVLFAMSPLAAQEHVFEEGDMRLVYDDGRQELGFFIGQDEWPLVASRAIVGSARLRGSSRVRAQSLFSLTAIAPENNKIVTLNTDVADEVSYSIADDGVSIEFFFEEGIGFTADFILRDDGLHVCVDTSSFVESEEMFISSMQFLPFFSASNVRDEGFLLIPDGEGALMNFNNGRRGTYNEPVYGLDKSEIRTVSVTQKMPLTLPMVGISKSGIGSMIAVATQGSAMANIVASTSYSDNPYNIAFFEFKLRKSIEQSIASDASQLVYESPRLFEGRMEVVYTPAGEEGYVSMADTFRSLYLDDDGRAEKRSILLSVKGGERNAFKVFGIPTPFSSYEAITSWDTVLSVLEDIEDTGSVLVNFEDWNRRSLSGKDTRSFSWLSAMGSRRDRNAVISFAEENGVLLSAAVEPVRTTSRGGDVTRDLSSQPSRQYIYGPASSKGEPDSVSYLRSIDKAVFATDDSGSFLPSYSTVGECISSNHSDKNGYDRQKYVDIVEEKLAESDGEYLVYGGNFYSLDGAVFVLDAPDRSSGMDIFDEDVPFYEMVISGICGFSFSPVNRSADPVALVLKSMETGASLEFEVTDGADFEWISDAIDTWQKDLSRVCAQRIVSHEKTGENSYSTVFSDGTCVTVDYDELSYSIQGDR